MKPHLYDVALSHRDYCDIQIGTKTLDALLQNSLFLYEANFYITPLIASCDERIKTIQLLTHLKNPSVRVGLDRYKDTACMETACPGIKGNKESKKTYKWVKVLLLLCIQTNNKWKKCSRFVLKMYFCYIRISSSTFFSPANIHIKSFFFISVSSLFSHVGRYKN